MPQDVVFLLGAGVSLAAGMPSTRELTRAVFSDAVFPHTDGAYYLGDHPQPDEMFRRPAREQVDAVRWFLAYAGSLIARYWARFENGRAPTYEDIYFLVGQLADDAVGQVDNPLALLFSEQTEQVFRTVIDDFSGKPFPSGHWSAARLAQEAVKLIQGMVAGKLWSPPAQPVEIGALLREAHTDPGVRRMHVFTLNHDRVLEGYFAAHGIDVEDGFEPKAIKGLCVRRPERYDASLRKVHLYKLHGSVDWHFDTREKILGRAIDRDAGRSLNDASEMLLGTFNKILAYQHPHYLDLHTRFRAALRACGRLVVSGYSFGDQAINSRIVEALCSDRSRAKAVIIHRDLAALNDGARGAIRKNWDRWERTHQFDFVEGWFQEAEWAEVATKLREPPEPEKWRPKTQQELIDDLISK